MIPFLFPFSRGLRFPLVALDKKIYTDFYFCFLNVVWNVLYVIIIIKIPMQISANHLLTLTMDITQTDAFSLNNVHGMTDAPNFINYCK